MPSTADLDAIGIERLREIGSLKWTAFPDTIGAFVAESDFGVAPVIAEALHKSVDDGLFGYLPPAVAAAMNDACATWQRDTYGWDVAPDDVHAIADVLTGLRLAITEHTKPGAKIIVPTPAYMPFLTIPGQLGREVVEVPMAGGVFDLDAIDDALEDGALFVLCNPYNPLGRVFTRAELAALADVIERHPGVRVFSDEIHAPLVMPGHVHVPYASLSEATAAHTLTATSASKAFNLPGLKCSQLIVSNPADRVLWERVAPTYGHGASNLGVVANTAAYAAGRPWLDDVLAYLDGNRRRLGELLTELIPGMGYVEPEGTYIAWLDARGLDLRGNAARFFREQAGVSLTDGRACGAVGDGHLRMILATPRPIMEEAVRRMAAALDA